MTATVDARELLEGKAQKLFAKREGVATHEIARRVGTQPV